MEKKNIIVCDVKAPFVYGGANIHVDNLTAKLKARGHNVEKIVLPEFLNGDDEVIYTSYLWRGIDLNRYTRKNIDLVISLKFPSYYIQHDNKVCWLMHQYRDIYDFREHWKKENIVFKENKYRDELVKMDKLALGECKKVFANSKNVAARLKKFNGLDSEPLYHPPLLADKLHFNKFGDYLFVISRLESHKRIDLVIKALVHTDKKVKLFVAGTGPEEQNLKKLVHDLKLNGRVKFLGFVSDEDLIKYYADCKAVVFTPLDEDYGYITLEAFLSYKLILTTTDAGGPLEFVRNAENGFICDPKPELLSKKMDEVYSLSEDRLIEMGNVAFDTVSGVTWDNVIDKILEYV